jgi:predicted nucleotidyltransferase
MITPMLHQALAAKADALPTIQLLYLFGSQVNNQIGPMSDYDFGVLLDRDADRRQVRALLAHEFATVLQTDRVDVVVLNDVPIELAYAVIAQGRRLFERTVPTRIEYEAEVMSRYGDYLPVLRAQRTQIIQGENHAARVQRYRTALRRTERALGALKTASEQAPN